MDKKTMKKVGITVAILGGLFLVFTFFSNEDAGQDLLLTSSVGGGEAAVIEDLFSILRELSQLKIDRSIFGEDSFKSLVDYSVVVTEQPKGRVNPFLPIE